MSAAGRARIAAYVLACLIAVASALIASELGPARKIASRERAPVVRVDGQAAVAAESPAVASAEP